MPSDPFYLTRVWKTFRAAILAERPKCERCPNRSQHVDHIRARRRGGAPYDRKNVMALCHSCHSTKTAAMDGGFGNPLRNRMPPLRGSDASGVPIDPNHHWNR